MAETNVGLRHGGDEARVVIERRLHEARPLGLEGQQHLEFVARAANDQDPALGRLHHSMD
jgi:hypothetical protein